MAFMTPPSGIIPPPHAPFIPGYGIFVGDGTKPVPTPQGRSQYKMAQRHEEHWTAQRHEEHRTHPPKAPARRSHAHKARAPLLPAARTCTRAAHYPTWYVTVTLYHLFHRPLIELEDAVPTCFAPLPAKPPGLILIPPMLCREPAKRMPCIGMPRAPMVPRLHSKPSRTQRNLLSTYAIARCEIERRHGFVA